MVRATEQIIQPQARRKRRRSWRKEPAASPHRRVSLAHIYRIVKAVGIAAVVVVLVAAYGPIASSSIFTLKQVRVTGNVRFPASQAEAIVREAMGQYILQGDLAEVRQALKQQPLIKDAVVTRILPDMLRVKLIEREPVAVVKSSEKLVCVDKEGVILGDFSLMGAQPALLGWDERTSTLSRSTNLERLKLYLELKQALGAADLNYWNKVDQVDVRNLRDVVVSLSPSPTTQIHLGDRDFRQRFSLIVNILDDLLGGRLQVTYIDVSDPSRVVVRPPKRSDAQSSASRLAQ
ncbi:MAG: FtsQ-type POTRA domain-containing protein [Acidobacteria bacterium]|nr:FtsQ-type POTRA domain-containing protein [Acidobacteriota bacterium]